MFQHSVSLCTYRRSVKLGPELMRMRSYSCDKGYDMCLCERAIDSRCGRRQGGWRPKRTLYLVNWVDREGVQLRLYD